MLNLIYKIERFILRFLNKLFYKGKEATTNIKYMSREELNSYIFNRLNSNEPFMIARFGSIELESTLYTYLCNLSLFDRYKLYIKKKIKFLRYDQSHANYLMSTLCNNAGFFPNDAKYLDAFGKKVRENDAKNCDCCCCAWNSEDLMIPYLKSEILFSKLNYLEPYEYEKPWTLALEGKKVLVIHPFVETIKKQYKRIKKIWSGRIFLPDFELYTIKAVQSIAGEKTDFNNWFEALSCMEKQMDAIDYDVAIIGCGAYGFSLAAHAKRCGKKAIHLGGATQIFFGIKGKRWDELAAVNQFYNEYWVYPSIDETPKNNKSVENGCYW